MSAQKKLDEINKEIAQLEQRLAVAHGLGESNSAQGITSTYSDNLKWQARLDALRVLRDRIIAAMDGRPSMVTPCTNKIYFN